MVPIAGARRYVVRMKSVTGRLLAIFGGIGLVLVGVVAGGAIADARRGAGMEETSGTIVGYEERLARSGSTARRLHPVIEFRATTGDVVRFTSEWGRQRQFLEVGSPVPVRYRPANPEEAYLASYAPRFGALTFVGLVAMPFLATATYLLVVFVRERRRRRRGERNLRREV